MLISERGIRRSGGGVLMRDVPPLIGSGPELILVQPKDLLDGWRNADINEDKKKSKGAKSSTPEQKLTSTEESDAIQSKIPKKQKFLRSVNISPDFSKFVRRPFKEERYRGGSKGLKTVATYDNGNDLLSELVPKKPSWDFASILKEIEEDSAASHTISALGCAVDDGVTSHGTVCGFTEVSLEGDEDVESDKIEERRKAENEEALTRLFDQILSDIYSHNLPPCAAKRLQRRCPERRSSDSTLTRLNGCNDGSLNRQMSFPGALARQTSLNETHQLLQPVKSISGIDRLSFTSNTTIGRIEGTDDAVLCETKLHLLTKSQIQEIRSELEASVAITGKLLISELEEKDNLTSEQDGLCEIATASLQAISNKTSDDARVKFSLTPATQDQSGFQEWARAMRMVARLPGGVPTHFRKNLWLSLAERHLHTKGVSWGQTERRLFSDTTNAEDKELSVQIVKDLHRTGCSLFCGVTGQHNQAVLKRVLLAYARWNKNVGYCQGLNMLAALILQVMQGSQSATVKVMIYLIEGVLPESYFANNLRGLSVDMAVFRDLLRLKLPELSKHLDHLQQESKDSGTTYEPPLCDVFTMQWFLTLFSNCLPQSTVLRVWDLVFLEGDQILLRTALAIWQALSDRMMSVRSADEFYSIMAVLTREMMEFGLMEPNSLIKAIDNMVVPEVTELREKYIYNISPWAVGTVAKMGVRLLYSDHGSPNLDESYREQKEAKLTPYSNHPDREKIALDISTLKRQYWKLRERQRQAHIILSANDVSACRSDNLAPGSSPALNHLLLGKRALLSAKGRRIEGTVPTTDHRRKSVNNSAGSSPANCETERVQENQTLSWREARTRTRKMGQSRSPTPSSTSSSSSSTELCDSSDSDESGGVQLDADVPEKTEVQDIEKQTQPNQHKDNVKDQPLPSSSSGHLSTTEEDQRLPVECWRTSLDENDSIRRERLVEETGNTTKAAILKSPVNSKVLPDTPGVKDDNDELMKSSRLSRLSLSPGDIDEDSQGGSTSDCHPSVLSHLSELSFSDKARISLIEGALASDSDTIEKGASSSFSSITQMDSGELDRVESFSFRRPCEQTKGDMHKAPSSTQLVNDTNWPRLPMSSYSSTQLGAGVEQLGSGGAPSSSHSSMQLGSVDGSSTYSSISSLPKDETLSSDWSKKITDEASTFEKLTGGDSPATATSDNGQAVEEKIKRRKSEIALLQILQENSQILQRIHQAHKVPSPDEPEDIKDIRRRYCCRQSSSLDSPRRTTSVEGSPSSLNRDVTIKLGHPDVNQ